MGDRQKLHFFPHPYACVNRIVLVIDAKVVRQDRWCGDVLIQGITKVGKVHVGVEMCVRSLFVQCFETVDQFMLWEPSDVM